MAAGFRYDPRSFAGCSGGRDERGVKDELARKAGPVANQDDAGARAPCPKACGANARAAAPCSIAPRWSATSTSARSARTTCASARAQRLELFLDPGTVQEIAAGLEPLDPLKFKDTKRYRDRLVQAQKDDGREGCAGGRARPPEGTRDHRLRVRVQVPGRLDGLGRRRALPARRAARASRISCRSSASPRAAARACRRLCSRSCRWRRRAPRSRAWRSSALPYISVLTDPTTGGVSASLAMLGDINIAEPKR